MTYAVRLEQFEGPLELLLMLIEKEKLDITRVSLARVADQYLEYLEQESTRTLGSLSQFLSIAARLILLKSRALLPLLEFTDDEEQSVMDLEWQLQEYQRYRVASQELGQLLVSGQASWTRERAMPQISEGCVLPSGLGAADIEATFVSILGEIPLTEPLEEEQLETLIHLEDKMEQFRQALAARMETSFQALTDQVENRVEFIVSFLALLQLIKERLIVVEQPECMGTITIRSVSHSSSK